MATPGKRDIKIAGFANLRDLGTLPVQGGVFKPKMVYRSTDLAGMPDSSFAAFDQLGVTTIYDLRTTAEISEAPDHLPAGIRSLHLDVLAGDSNSAAASEKSLFSDPSKVNAMLGDGKAEQLMLQSYREIIELPSALAAYKAYFLDLADPSRTGAALFHCTTGKDRTGWAAASLLTLLGADKDTVYSDYLETNTDILPFTQPMYDQAKAAGIDPTLLEPILGVKREYLDEAFTLVEQKYGSFDAYMRQGLGLGDDTFDALRKLFIV